VDQGQFSDSDFFRGTHQMGNVQFADNIDYYIHFTLLFALMRRFQKGTCFSLSDVELYFHL
jgi:hypothetical protein